MSEPEASTPAPIYHGVPGTTEEGRDSDNEAFLENDHHGDEPSDGTRSRPELDRISVSSNPQEARRLEESIAAENDFHDYTAEGDAAPHRNSFNSAVLKASNHIRRFTIRNGATEHATPKTVQEEPRSWATSTAAGIPHSSYYTGPPGLDSAYGTDPVGEIGVHHPREILRVERDYSAGELPQFHAIFPLELEGRVTPTQFQETINDINEILISAYSVPASARENVLAAFTLYLSLLVRESHYSKEMRRLERLIDHQNATIYQPRGLRILWPRKTALLFLEIEYY